MKKLFVSIYFTTLVLLLPAIFLGYLYHQNTNVISNPVKSQAAISSTQSDETAYKPGLLFVIKGI